MVWVVYGVFYRVLHTNGGLETFGSHVLTEDVPMRAAPKKVRSFMVKLAGKTLTL